MCTLGHFNMTQYLEENIPFRTPTLLVYLIYTTSVLSPGQNGQMGICTQVLVFRAKTEKIHVRTIDTIFTTV